MLWCFDAGFIAFAVDHVFYWPMPRARNLSTGAIVLAAVVAVPLMSAAPPPQVTARRLPRNPLITVESCTVSSATTSTDPRSSESQSGSNGRSGGTTCTSPITRARFIRLAYADGGRSGALDGSTNLASCRSATRRSTVRSPIRPRTRELLHARRVAGDIRRSSNARLVMWLHGWFTDGQRWPAAKPRRGPGRSEHRYGQYTQVGESVTDGPSARYGSRSRAKAICVFLDEGRLFGLARLGLLLRSPMPLRRSRRAPNPFAGRPYAGRVRHVAVVEARHRRSRSSYGNRRCAGTGDGVDHR